MKRTPIKRFGRITKERSDRRVQWIADHPPKETSDGRKYYFCHICVYFQEEPAVAIVWFNRFVLEHIEAKGHLVFGESQEDDNLGPAHWDCNNEKGSQQLWQMKLSPQTGKPNPYI